MSQNEKNIPRDLREDLLFKNMSCTPLWNSIKKYQYLSMKICIQT